MLKYLLLIALAGCAAAKPQDACSLQCNRVVDTCMDASSVMQTSYALDRLTEQCGAAQKSCLSACRQDQTPQ